MEERKFDSARMKPIEFFVVAKNLETGYEAWYRTSYLQGFSKKSLAAAFATGEPLEGYFWRKVPALYRIVTHAGQEFKGARWSREKNGFIVDGLDVVFSRKGCREIWEYSE